MKIFLPYVSNELGIIYIYCSVFTWVKGWSFFLFLCELPGQDLLLVLTSTVACGKCFVASHSSCMTSSAILSGAALPVSFPWGSEARPLIWLRFGVFVAAAQIISYYLVFILMSWFSMIHPMQPSLFRKKAMTSFFAGSEISRGD